LDFLRVVEGRRSIRNFLDEQIPEEKTKEIIRIGMFAPSAGNKQGWRFLSITNKELKNQMKKIIQEKAVTIARHAGKPNPESFYQRRPLFHLSTYHWL